MSATLRYDVGLDAGSAITFWFDKEFIDATDFKVISRWGGLYRSRRECYTFSLKLPRQISISWKLFEISDNLRKVGPGNRVMKGCGTLFRKLCLSLGMPHLGVIQMSEKPFLDSITENPGDLGNWSAYSDWLQDRADDQTLNQPKEPMVNRGLVIAGWLSPKPVEVKYGVPVQAKDYWK